MRQELSEDFAAPDTTIGTMSEFLNLLEIRGQSWCSVEIGSTCGFSVAPTPSVIFYACLQGSVRIAGVTGGMIELRPGDVRMILSGEAHAVRVSPASPTKPLDYLRKEIDSDAPPRIRIGNGQISARVLCGRLRVDWPTGLRRNSLPASIKLDTEKLSPLNTVVRVDTLQMCATGADAVASHALFVTLDPLVRRIRLPDARQLLVSDTVGFIDRLPHQLVASFLATLEEVNAADLLVHVIDGGAEDRDRRVDAVKAVLHEVGADTVPMLEVYNKVDLVSRDELARLKAVHRDALFISATKAASRAVVTDALVGRLAMDAERVTLELDGSRERDRRVLAELYRFAKVISHVTDEDRVRVEADVPRRLLPKFQRARVA